MMEQDVGKYERKTNMDEKCVVYGKGDKERHIRYG
jgi:hypothetical protein